MSNISRLGSVFHEEAKAEVKPVVWETMGDFMGRKPSPWLVRGWIKQGKTNILYGPSMTLKSFVALDMALSIAYHVPFIGTFPTRPGKVAYVYSESPDGGPQRIEAWMYAKKIEAMTPNFMITTARLGLISDGAPEAVITSLEAFKPDLIIIDTMSKNFGGDENSSEDAAAMIAAIEVISEAIGAAVLLVHHTGKDGTREERGHSSLRGNIDSSFKVDRDGDFITIENKKMKDTGHGDKVVLKAKKIILRTTHDEYMGDEEISSLVLEQLSEEDQNELAKAEAMEQQKENVKVLAALESGPLAYDTWAKAVMIQKTRFVEVRKRLEQSQYVMQEAKRKPYQLTEAGKGYLLAYGQPCPN